MTTNMPNKFAGRCGRCASKVDAGAGFFDRSEGGCVHATVDDCKKTTKSFKNWDNHRRFVAAAEARTSLWVEAGFIGHPEFHAARGVTGLGRVDGVRVSFTEGGWAGQESVHGDHVRMTVGGIRCEFDLDREAIRAADTGSHEGSVPAAAEHIRQIVAGARAALTEIENIENHVEMAS